MTGVPETRYARFGDSYVAYQVTGHGPDVVYVPTAMNPIDLLWDDPVSARGLRRLATEHRLILCDLLGVGSSDPVLYGEMPAMQIWADSIGAVLDAAEAERVAIVAMAESGLPALLYAASHPERVRALALWAPFARFARADDHPWGMPDAALDQYLSAFSEVVGSGALVDDMAPSRANEDWFRAWWGKGERLSAGRGYFTRVLELFLRSDVRPALGSIHVPTLLARRTGDWHVRDGHATAMAEAIAGARLVELAGDDHVWFSGDADQWIELLGGFLTGNRSVAPSSRSLATVLFTDIVGSTEQASELGDALWRERLEAHDALVRRYVSGYRGEVVKFTGDGVLAIFDGPARAIQCARDLTRAVREIDLEIRAGLHTGEVEQYEGDVHGIAVHLAARVMALARPGDVYVSAAIPPLVLGSGLRFAEGGRHVLKGVPGEWTVYRVDPTLSAAGERA